jgi:hypothetical protein
MSGHYSCHTPEKCYADEMKSLLTWRQPLGLSRQSETTRLRSRTPLAAALVCFLNFPVFAASWTVQAQPPKLVNGAPLLFRVKSPSRLESLSGSWFGHPLTFSYQPSSKTWFALAGVGFDIKPGRYKLELTGTTPAKTLVTFARMFPVGPANYPKIKVQLAVDRKFTEPDPEQVKQIADSNKIKEEHLNQVTPEREWDGNFAPPVDAPTSDVYGSQRIFNGVAQRPHYGLDFRVHTGTPVKAMNDGTVLLARFLYYEGNFVVIDHGQGLLTMYLHLSQLETKEGEVVKRGQEIGLSGGSGRATGPHLDVRVRWQGVYLDPARLLQMSLP